MDYDIQRYFSLLEQEEILKKQGVSFYTVNQEDYMELLKYKVRLENQKYWENRQKYVSVISEFLNGITTAEDFSDEFLDLWKKDRDRDRDLSKMNFEPDTISEEFSSLIGKVFSCCEIFEPESKEYDEKWLKNSIKKIFSEMQTYLDE
jgi:predicted house-cleaning noncanonical NTP pyrophosphatase (MazG superfamily)